MMGDMSQIEPAGAAAEDVRGVCPCCGHEQAWRTPDQYGRDGTQCLLCLGWVRPSGEWDEGPAEDGLWAGSAWRHVKTGGTYTVVCVAVCATNGRGPERGVVYRSHADQALYYREVSEFLDGRFVPLGRGEA